MVAPLSPPHACRILPPSSGRWMGPVHMVTSVYPLLPLVVALLAVGYVAGSETDGWSCYDEFGIRDPSQLAYEEAATGACIVPPI